MKLKKGGLRKTSLCDFLINNSIYIAIAILVIIVEIQKPEFFAALPLNLLNRTAAYVMMALGMGSIMLIGGVDLSAGCIMGLTSLVGASFLVDAFAIWRVWPNLPAPTETRIFLVLILVLIIGAGIGCFNGFFVGKFRLHPFIVTLCMQFILYGMMLIFIGLGPNNAGRILQLYEKYSNLIGKPTVTDTLNLPVAIPNYVWYSIIAIIAVWLIWNHTSFGKKLRIYGEDHENAVKYNINSLWITIGAFAIAGALYGLNGFIEAARVGGLSTSTGVNKELDAIAACLIGGVSFCGGKGKVSGVVLGVVLFQLIEVSLQWLSVTANYVYIIKGIIIIWAAAVDAYKNYRGRGVQGWKW